jgi:hypothetical protein
VDSLVASASGFDRSGSAVLEELLNSAVGHFPGLPPVGLVEVLAVSVWHLWWIRQAVTHGEGSPSLGNWKLSILALSNYNAKMVPRAAPRGNLKWIKLDKDILKLNVDASFHSEENAGSTDVVIRDSHGNFIAASGSFVSYASEASTMEAIAMKEGLSLVAPLGCNQTISESDCFFLRVLNQIV